MAKKQTKKKATPKKGKKTKENDVFQEKGHDEVLEKLDAKALGKMKRGKRQEYFLKHYVANLGIVRSACKSSGIGSSTFYYWCEQNKAFKNKVNKLEEIIMTEAEDSLKEFVVAKNLKALFFVLGRRSPKYKPKQEITDLTKPRPVTLNIRKYGEPDKK